MAEHSATVLWQRAGAKFTDNRYSRAHRWIFDGGLTVPASASPHVVPIPLSEPSNVDPEEAFVAALSSCHMLWFLSIAARRGFVVDAYRDEAVGRMEKNEEGRLAITRVTLHPRIEFASPKIPDARELEGLHAEAHDNCFIASSVRTKVSVEPASHTSAP
jgi:organic hydroperoxide reductase OsmC/OhrA